MNDAVDCIINILDNQGDKEQNKIAGHDVKISVIDRDFEGATVATRKSDNRLDNISKVA